MRAIPIVLERSAGVDRFFAEQFAINTVLIIREGVDDDVVIVGVRIANEFRHRPLFLSGLRVFLTKIPIEREGITEARDHFAEV